MELVQVVYMDDVDERPSDEHQKARMWHIRNEELDVAFLTFIQNHENVMQRSYGEEDKKNSVIKCAHLVVFICLPFLRSRGQMLNFVGFSRPNLTVFPKINVSGGNCDE